MLKRLPTCIKILSIFLSQNFRNTEHYLHEILLINTITFVNDWRIFCTTKFTLASNQKYIRHTVFIRTPSYLIMNTVNVEVITPNKCTLQFVCNYVDMLCMTGINILSPKLYLYRKKIWRNKAIYLQQFIPRNNFSDSGALLCHC